MFHSIRVMLVWYHIMFSIGYVRCSSDTCVYVRTSATGRVMILCIFVDDTISAYHKEDEQEWEHIKKQFMSEYKMKDMGDCEWILGMKERVGKIFEVFEFDGEKLISELNKDNPDNSYFDTFKTFEVECEETKDKNLINNAINKFLVEHEEERSE